MSCAAATSSTIHAHAGIARGSASRSGLRSSRRIQDRLLVSGVVKAAASPHASVAGVSHNSSKNNSNSNDEDDEEEEGRPPASRPPRPEQQPRDAIPDDRDRDRDREELVVGEEGFRTGRRVVLGGAALTAAATAFFSSDPAATFRSGSAGSIAQPPAAAAATAPAPAAAADLAPFVGRATRRLIVSKCPLTLRYSITLSRERDPPRKCRLIMINVPGTK